MTSSSSALLIILLAVVCCCLHNNDAADPPQCPSPPLQRTYSRRCHAKQRGIIAGAVRAARTCLTGASGTNEQCYAGDDGDCEQFVCRNDGMCIDQGTKSSCATAAANQYSYCTHTMNNFNCYSCTTKAGIADPQLLARCAVKLQDEHCGQPSSAQYVGCLRSNYPKCFNDIEYNAQQERWVTRIMDISDACKVCSDELIMGRRRVLSGFANLMSVQAVAAKSASAFDDASNVRDAIEVKLCEERNMFANSSSTAYVRSGTAKAGELYEPMVFATESQLRKDFGQCVAREMPGALTSQVRQMRRQCVTFLKDVLSVDYVFGKNFLNFL